MITRKVIYLIFLLAGIAFIACDQKSSIEVDETYIVDPQKQYQTIEGFGSSLINFGPHWKEFPAIYRTEEFQKFYVQEMGMNMLRCNLWGGVLMNPVENWQDIRFQDFDLSVSQIRRPKNRRDMQVFVDFAKAMVQLNPDAKIIGTVWAPPPWMKMNNELTDTASGAIYGDRYINRKTKNPIENRLQPEYYKHYAKYLTEWVKLFEHHTGKPLYGISIGNEVMFTQAFGSCTWTAEDYGKMIVELGQMLESEGYEAVKIYGPETMTSHNSEIANPMYVKVLTETPAAQYLDVFATHGYVDGFEQEYGAEALIEFRKMIADTGKPLWITEGGTGGHRWPEPLTGIGAAIHNAAVHGNVAAFTPWQIAGVAPNHHCMMVYDQPTPKTYAAQHFFKFIESGMVRIEASPVSGNINISAFMHPQKKKLTIVMINPEQYSDVVGIELQAETAGLSEIKAFRTSETERMHPVQGYDFEQGLLKMKMVPQSIVTITGIIAN